MPKLTGRESISHEALVHGVILSGAIASRVEATEESKDPYRLHERVSGDFHTGAHARE
jgi:hypothetical protein